MSESPVVAVVGAGPAGLMAAEALAARGHRVHVFDAMPSAGRKFLLAGKGGLNLTHAEPFDAFVGRYGDGAGRLLPSLQAFGADAVRAWAASLGIDTFVGSSGRVFPIEMKAAPLLRAWLHRLRSRGVRFSMRHRWQGWADDDGRGLRFATPHGNVVLHPAATVLALGGGSWPRLGSDGAWLPWLGERGVDVAPLLPSNCGFDVGWSAHFAQRHAGAPLKNVAIDFDGWRQLGECVVTATGVEGSLVYAASARLRDRITAAGHALLHLDLLPALPPDRVEQALAQPRGSRSLSNTLKARLGLSGAKAGLVWETVGADDRASPARLARAIKSLPLRLVAPRPLAEAISSAGGVRFGSLDGRMMLRPLPGVFCAGEMLDWEAPTGGYLLQACFSTARAAAQGILRRLAR